MRHTQLEAAVRLAHGGPVARGVNFTFEVFMGINPVAKKKLPEGFFCKFLNREVKTVECVDDYVNANSLNIRHSPCFKCSVGLKTRLEYANS